MGWRGGSSLRAAGYWALTVFSGRALILTEVTSTWLWSVPPVSAPHWRLTLAVPPIVVVMVSVPQLFEVSAPLMNKWAVSGFGASTQEMSRLLFCPKALAVFS